MSDDDLEYEWDEEKYAANQLKHGISFQATSRVFADPFVLQYEDDFRGEDRWNALGYVDGRLLHVTYTLRGTVTRIISARGAYRNERKDYHEV